EFHAELFGEGGEDVLLLGEVALDEDLVQGPGRGQGADLGDPREILRLENPTTNETLRELHAPLLDETDGMGRLLSYRVEPRPTVQGSGKRRGVEWQLTPLTVRVLCRIGTISNVGTGSVARTDPVADA